MKKLVNGIVEFRQNILPGYREKFAKLALGQHPDTLFIACSDSRVVPNLFASTDPGDLFVIRNVGNLIPCCGEDGHSVADESEAAAIEFSLQTLKVSDIIVCGHSECGAMQALVQGRDQVGAPHLKAWLRHGEPALNRAPLEKGKLSRHDEVSQLNVLQQIEHLKTYPIIQKQLAAGKVSVHAWWFELRNADVYAFDEAHKKFVLIDEAQAQRILERMN